MKATLNPTPESVLAHHRPASHKGWKSLRKFQTAVLQRPVSAG